MAIIRYNPTRAPQQKPLGQTMPNESFGGGMRHVASSVTGNLYSHLGHFGQQSILRAGHNTNGHPGFAAVQAGIAKREGVSKERAGAMLAASTRRASAKAKRKNPNLKRVKG